MKKLKKQLIDQRPSPIKNNHGNEPPPGLSIREIYQTRENKFISPFGCPSALAGERSRPETPCSIRTPFQLDRDRIVYSNAFRRLKYKTQVFLSPLGDHYRTRMTHTLEVSETARNIARAMRLNEDLAEAIALGHDLGHTPFGHGGETALKEIYHPGFSHNEQSLRVVEVLENKGAGLNLTPEVKDGILKHSKGFGDIMPSTPGATATTLEGKIVRIADIIAYLNHDLDDALRSGVIKRSEIPAICTRELGENHPQRARSMIQSLVYCSVPHDNEFQLCMGEKVYTAMTTLRRFLYEEVYRSPSVHKEFIKAKKVLKELYQHFIENLDSMQKELEKMEMAAWDGQNTTLERTACDIIASMTDRYALELYSKLFFPQPHV
ncbi:dGTPase [Desulfocicer vacuolatum DSM 3385]|uniref:dGTPase n=1 Tax=Desulfocicer vacuolatum DSM 3385 TaxID=1121400 RepID=A0A1W1ZVC1_9BACT|nr:dGTPase [Desulfocicer vacuolatum DSM 3385]